MGTERRPFTIRAYDTMDETQVLELLERSLGPGPTGRRDARIWRWKHWSNPFGPSYVYLACNAPGEVIGLRTFMRWQFQMENRIVNAVRAVDTATHPQYQRQGIFTSLTLHALQEIKKDGIDLVFNTPNAHSLPGYLKMGWQRVGTVKPLIKVIDYPRFLIGLAKAGLFRQRDRQNGSLGFLERGLPSAGEFLEGGEAEILLQEDLALHDKKLLSTKRTREYLEWRYGQHPGYGYKSLVERRSGKLVCAAIIRANNRFGLREVMLDELWTNTADERLIHNLFCI